ncbi:MAG TPA: extracellular solute-binding protein [Chloroflexota bacterium]|nr:extracellular solute-binding protein [Chloroflexota bacterium]
MSRSFTRRDFMMLFGAASTGLLAAACSSAGPAQPTAAPSKPATSGGAPATSAPAQPAAAPPQTAPGGTNAATSAWNDLVAAAKKEGKVVIQTPVGSGYREGVDAFMAEFPGIEAEIQSFPDGATFVPKIQGERKAGVYTFDVASTTVVPVLQILKGEGTYEPLKPEIIHPEALDDKAWYKGFDGRWADTAHNMVFKHQFSANPSVYINTNFVKEDEIKSIDDLLDPKWKGGKIVSSDLQQGYVYTPSTILRETKGEDFLRKLFVGQEPQIIRDRRQTVETLVRGAAQVGFGIHPLVLNEFVRDGLANHIKPLYFPNGGTSGGEIVVIFNKAPHPNAGKLFANWILTKDGQTIWSKSLNINSARLDVPVIDPGVAPGKVDWGDATQEEGIPKITETQEFLKTLATGS